MLHVALSHVDLSHFTSNESLLSFCPLHKGFVLDSMDHLLVGTGAPICTQKVQTMVTFSLLLFVMHETMIKSCCFCLVEN